MKGSPGSHNSVGGAEGEVCQILVRRMSGADSHMRRFVNEHGVDGLYVISTETFEVGNEVGVGAVGLEDIVKLEILNFGDIFFSD